MLKMIAKPLFLVMCAAMSFTAPMDICMAQDKQETLGQSVKEQIPFTLGYLTTTSHLLAFIAKEEGYFAEEGLDVELSKYARVSVLMATMLRASVRKRCKGTAHKDIDRTFNAALLALHDAGVIHLDKPEALEKGA